MCANRIYVQDGIHDELARRLARAMAGFKVGNGLEPGVTHGPLINEAAVQKVESHVADALSKGARLLTGGRRPVPGQLFFEPTLLVDVNDSMQVCEEETFGPLAPLFRFHDEDEVVRRANDTIYGLAAYLFTNDNRRIWRVSRALEYGMVGINTGLISNEVAPFGGVKQSGLGREARATASRNTWRPSTCACRRHEGCLTSAMAPGRKTAWAFDGSLARLGAIKGPSDLHHGRFFRPPPSPSEPLRIAVMGAGAVGCYFGALLARAGHQVTLIGRPAHVQAVQQHGLRLETAALDIQVPMQASTEASAVRDADVVMFCVKSTATEEAAREMQPHLAPGTLVLTMQNGVDNDERVRAVLGRPWPWPPPWSTWPLPWPAPAMCAISAAASWSLRRLHSVNRWPCSLARQALPCRYRPTCAARCGPSW